VAGLSGDSWQIVSSYLDTALEMTDEARRAWLADLRAADPALAGEIEALLEEGRALDEEGFLEDSAPQPPHSSESLAGQAFGAYTLISLIGQGGMGNVWLARRSDGRFEGRAAVKMLNASLRGRAGEERFRREGTILARLTHPHVAHLLDAGVSPAGQPYLVLEYVEGERIDQYCDEQRLGVEARLRLFLDVLDAVAHAHAHLIIHRDIKPSNVLVRKDGQVKLLDFGIAKLLEGDAGGVAPTALTREGGHVLTPEYAAPEQVAGGTVTTATDVYALGNLLYVLLVGRHPAEAALRSPADLFKAIAETEPPQPSNAVSTRTVTAEVRISNAALRGTTPDGLRRVLKGDLDTIVAKALKKNPAERYASPAQLKEDLGRYLDHQPIGARPDTLVYRASKFVRRNLAASALGSLVVLALLAGLVGTLSQARRATRDAALAETQRGRADQSALLAQKQRDFALRQLSRAEAINDMNTFLLSDAAPAGQPFTVGQLLARAEDILQRENGESDENRVEMLVAVGSQYISQDQDDKALQLLGKAHELASKLPDHSLRAKAACALANSLVRSGKPERAESLIQEGLRELPDEPQFALDRVFCLSRGSWVARETGDVKAGVDRILAAQRLLKESRLSSALADLTVAMDVAESYRMAGRLREATAAFREAFEKMSSLGRDETEKAGTLFNNWGLTEDFLGRPLEAERLYRRAVRISSADRTEESVSPMLLNNLARALKDLDRFSEAAHYADRAYAKAKQAGDEIVVNQSLIVREGAYRGLGDLGRASRLLSELEPRLRRMLPPGHAAFASLASEQALLAQARGDFSAARAAADRAVAIAEASGQREIFLPLTLLRRSQLALRMRAWEPARNDAEKALGMYKGFVGPGVFSCRVGRCYAALGRAFQGLGKLGEARAALSAALENLDPSQGKDHPETVQTRRLEASIPAAP
jgi:serine/threonine protein kinase